MREDNDIAAITSVKVSLTSGLDEEKTQSQRKKYTVRNKKGDEILKGNEMKESGENELKTIILVDTVGQEFYKIVHRVGVSVVKICSVDGKILGATTVSFRFCCCCVLKPKYTYRLNSGKDMLILKGRITCCQPRLQIKVYNEDGENVGLIKMGDTLSYNCDIEFNSQDSLEERHLLVALSIGFLDATYEKQQMRAQKKGSPRLSQVSAALENEG